MKKNLTIVTALFDIGRGDLNSGFGRSFEHYKECFKRLLSIDLPMVIYVEPSLQEFVYENRKHENTRIVVKSIDDLKRFPFFDKIQKIRNDMTWKTRSGWIMDSPQSALELYNPVVMHKMFFLNDATLYNYFNTKYYLWVDAGISNTLNVEHYLGDENFIKSITPYLNKMLYLAFPYDGKVEVHGFEKNKLNEYAGKDTEYVVRGGVFGGNTSTINEMNGIYYHLLNDTLSEGLMGTEESIFTIMAHKYPKKCNVQFIDANGLVYKFFEDLKANSLSSPLPEHPLAFYFLTFNTPEQFTDMLDTFTKVYPQEFEGAKKYVVDNSTDMDAHEKYKKLYEKYNIELIHSGKNLGIQDGRQLVAKHFNASDHLYYIFFEEDMYVVQKDKGPKDGFITYHEKLFEKSIDILNDNKLDYLRLTILEFFGECTHDWSFKNVPLERRNIYFPEREDGDEDLRWKTKIEYLGFYDGLAYAVGHFHYSNWPILFNKEGNKKVFLDIEYEHLFEQTIMSQTKTYLMEGKMKVGCLLAAPIQHSRFQFYDGKIRRENRHYTN